MKYQLPNPEIDEVPTCSPAGYTADQMHAHYALGYAAGLRSSDALPDEEFWNGVCETLEAEYVKGKCVKVTRTEVKP